MRRVTDVNIARERKAGVTIYGFTRIAHSGRMATRSPSLNASRDIVTCSVDTVLLHVHRHCFPELVEEDIRLLHAALVLVAEDHELRARLDALVAAAIEDEEVALAEAATAVLAAASLARSCPSPACCGSSAATGTCGSANGSR